MIRHTVQFRLNHPRGSAEEDAFLGAIAALAGISSTRNVELLRQVSPKNDFTFGLSMEFDDAAGYVFYNEHPEHTAFVRDRWVPEVADFLEADFEVL